MKRAPVKVDLPDEMALHLQPSAEIITAIGKLAIVAAMVEDELNYLYWRYAGLKPAVGMIVTDNMRPKKLAEDIVRISKISDASAGRRSDLADIATAYSAMATKRNRVIHWSWGVDDKGNSAVFKPPFVAGFYPPPHERFTATDIDKITAELGVLYYRAKSHAETDSRLRSLRKRHGGKWAKSWPAPWLDTPTQPVSTPSVPHVPRKRQPRQPLSSQE